jgi:hypothetical protein
MVDAFRRSSYRLWLGALMAAGGLAVGLTACAGEDVCRSGDPTPDCSQETGGVKFVTTCEAADSTGRQSCTTMSEGQTLEVLCGKDSNPSGCSVRGDARKTTGITADTTGILLDHDGAALALSIDAFASGAFESGLDIEILAAAVGDGPAELTVTLEPCAGCPGPVTIDVDHDYAWIQVAHLPQQASAGTLVLSGSGIEIGDVRMKEATTRSPRPHAGCGGPPGVFAP